MVEKFEKAMSEMKLELKFNNSKYNKYFRSLNAFNKFISDEVDFWNDLSKGKANDTRNKFVNLKRRFNTLQKHIEDGSWKISQAKDEYKNMINYFNSNAEQNILSITPEGKKLKDIYVNNSISSANGFWSFLTKQNINANKSDELFGAIEAYRMTNNWINQTELSTIKQDLDDNITKYNEQIDDIYADYNKALKEYKNDFDKVLSESQKFKESTEKQIENFIEKEKKDLEDTKLLYAEHIKLREPADYWKKLENEYYCVGRKWMIFAIVSSIVFLIFLTTVLYNNPSFFDTNINQYSFNTVKGTLIFALIVSIMVYVIRLFVKLSLSGYHLARDAKERYQLSYVYLSLINDSAIDESDRSIVLQALFTRADTGLLHGDTGPKMPVDSITSQISK
ncbi:MAG: DUF6161 domain-containing protein [Candidatus Woesearchaeota archaeon]